MAVLHFIGALAWLGAIAALALARRLGRGPSQRDLVRRVASRYTVLAGGGLALVVVTGIANLRLAAPTGFDLGALTHSSLGKAYIVVLAAKLGLVAASIVLSFQIGASLAVDRPRAFAILGARSLSAAAEPGASDRALRLAELNAALGGMILLAVIVLSQLHHALR